MRTRSKPGLAANTYPEIRRGVKIAAEELDELLKQEGERWEQGHLLEAMAADFLTQPFEEQVRRAQRGQRIAMAIRERESPGKPLTVQTVPELPEVEKGAASPPIGTPIVSAPYSVAGPRKNKEDTAEANHGTGRGRSRRK